MCLDSHNYGEDKRQKFDKVDISLAESFDEGRIKRLKTDTVSV